MTYATGRVNLSTFVGRRAELEALHRRHMDGRSWLLEAGRRFGKTMLMRRFVADLGPAVVYVDCQSFGDTSTALDFFGRLGELVEPGVAPVTDVLGLETLFVALGRTCTVVLDEADALLRHHWGVAALENVRYLVSNSSVASSTTVGLVGGMHLAPRLTSAGSPVANVCDKIGLGPLTYEDVVELVSLGIDGPDREDVTEVVWRLAGGHPYLDQSVLAEIVVGGVPMTRDRVDELTGQLEEFVRRWIDDAKAGDLGSRLPQSALGRRRVKALLASGLFRSEAELLVANGALIETLLGPTHRREATLDECLRRGESDSVEFKATLRLDLRTMQVSQVVESEVARAVAAMANFEGGTVLVGVEDDGHILGIQREFKTLGRKNRDAWELKLREVLNRHLDRDFVASAIVEYEEHEESTVAIIRVPRSQEAVWFQDTSGPVLIVRSGNSSQVLNARESQRYLRARHPAGDRSG